MLKLYNLENLKYDTTLFIEWIDQAEAIISEKVDLADVDRYLAAFVYMFYRHTNNALTKKNFDVTRYKLDKTIEF